MRRPWWDGSDELRRYREHEQAEQQAQMTAKEVGRFGRTVVSAFGRGIGWTLGRRLVNSIFGRG